MSSRKHPVILDQPMSATIIHAGDVTTAIVRLAFSDEDLDEICDESFFGVSKCRPEDKYDPVVGATLAYGRALQSAGKALEKRANGTVKHHDDVAVRKAQLKAQKKRHPSRVKSTKK